MNPVLKYRGGKTREMPRFLQYIPDNVDRYIEYAKAAGFTMMLMYHTCFYKGSCNYCGDYEWNDHYPNGADTLRPMLEKIKKAGITPGFHFLHPHIGIKSQYVTPVADHRLHLTRYFTLAKPLSETDDTIYVEQNPAGCPMYYNEKNDTTRILKFGGELITYESYSTE